MDKIEKNCGKMSKKIKKLHKTEKSKLKLKKHLTFYYGMRYNRYTC